MRLGGFVHEHFHHIEPEWDIRVVEHAQPGKRAERDSPLLVAVDGCDRTAEILTSARFYFHEHERVVVATDNVDLTAAPRFKIPIENLVSVPPQKTGRQPFPTRAADVNVLRGIRRAREVAAPPVQKSGDGLDKARVHGAW